MKGLPHLFTGLLSVVSLVGCQTTRDPEPVPSLGDAPAAEQPHPEFGYYPDGFEQFVFTEVPEALRRFGYGGFCQTAEPCDWRLPYGLYVGMRGYFLSETPLRETEETAVYPVRFETGETYYYFASKRLGGKYSPVAPIIPLEEHMQAEQFRPQPLARCSNLMVTRASVEFGETWYRLDNQRKISEARLRLIREVAARYAAPDSGLPEDLLDLDIKQTSQGLQIEPLGTLKSNDIRLVIRLHGDEPELYLRVQYYGEEWLYLRMLEFSGDTRKWERWGLRVLRQARNGRYREWIEVPVTTEEIAIVEELAYSRIAMIRFEGARVYDLLRLHDAQKEDLIRVLRTWRNLRFSPSADTTGAAC